MKGLANGERVVAIALAHDAKWHGAVRAVLSNGDLQVEYDGFPGVIHTAAPSLLAPEAACPPGAVPLCWLDPDFRKEPQTQRFCVVCQRDLKASARVIRVRAIETPDALLLVEDEAGQSLIGSECGQCGRKFRAAQRRLAPGTV